MLLRTRLVCNTFQLAKRNFFLTQNIFNSSTIMDSDFVDSGDEDFAPVVSSKTSTAKTAGPPKKPLSNAQNKANMGPAKKVSENSQKYQKLSQLDHVLLRPDTYVGSVESFQSEQWVISDEEPVSMERKVVSVVPGLFKIFDEILVNAADNKIRDPTMTRIDVVIDAENNLIEVKNDGKGIPVEIHEEEKIYIPELIFGHLLTSSNYDDDEKKVTGGRNGYGAKLCNIFSTSFTIETADKQSGKVYKQTWSNNMSSHTKPKITAMKTAKEYTKISFNPDLSKFGMERLDADILGVLRRRVYDICGSVRGIKVYLDGKLIKISNFSKYVEMYVKSLEATKVQFTEVKEEGALTPPPSSSPTIVYQVINDRWEIAFSLSDGTFNQVSFVNSIATTAGGTHVNLIADMLVDKIIEQTKKKNKRAMIKPFQVRNNMFLFINCLIENPAFTSQTKEQLTTRPSQFGGKKMELPDEFVKKVLKSGIVDSVLDIAAANADKALKKGDGSRKSRVTGYPKLEDANKAGTKDGHKCTLILTEGDSAHALAVAGLAVVGRDFYGCYPLRGKMLNVREATVDQIMKNAEISAIKQIMGLQHKKKYDTSNINTLRYGRIMIMTDQDHDGSHIKGLIINFLESSFPGLLSVPGFLIEFITPIVKITMLTGPEKGKVIPFYNMPEYEEWRDNIGNTYSYKQKYYKGLGTSSPAEMREYFGMLDKHLKHFHELQPPDVGLIELAFSKKKADDRKEWLRGFQPGTFLDPDLQVIPISEFINKELILFSMADNIRSIPSVLDGFKPSQRKILYGCYKRNLSSEIKVSQLAGYIGEHTGYHHGDASLIQSIVGLAQDFVGSNNMNLLMPLGGFGTRGSGGKDASAARYIYTELASITKKVFNPKDNPLLTYLQDDEQTVEPEWYIPIIPMILVNGAEGIGTGWSSNIPSYNPADIIDNIRRLLDDEELEEMVPWYRGWEGDIIKLSPDKYKVEGKIEQIDESTVEISELPIKMWTVTMKEYLLQGLAGTEKQKPWIKDMQEQHGVGIKFVITLTQEEMAKSLAMGLKERFKLVTSLSTANMVAFDANGRIKKYNDVKDILKDYYNVRLHFYQLRKDHMVEQFSNQLEKLSAQARFIKLIIDRELVVSNKKKKDLVAELQSLKFPSFDKNGAPVKAISRDDSESDEEDIVDADTSIIHKAVTASSSYDYLLGLPIWSLTRERYEKLLAQKIEKENELTTLLALSAKDLWKVDLHDLREAWDKLLEDDLQRRLSGVADIVTKKKRARKTKAKKEDDDDDDFAPNKKKVKTSAAPKTKAKTNDVLPPSLTAPKQENDIFSSAIFGSPIRVDLSDAEDDMALDDSFSKFDDVVKASAFPSKASKDEVKAKPATKKVLKKVLVKPNSIPAKKAPPKKAKILDDEDELSHVPVVVPAKNVPKRAAAKKAVKLVDSDEEMDSVSESQPESDYDDESEFSE
ncbi:unnamed protein product [Kuraishia capsulata CBS 1993]|uniref:DNA topoisomerase 2 n=1 Tax=Kuraishia capsulata CBS 1993 TaxID=1382522 RepID=W6MU72_9ASCO|nr:uncharacterized protein KUCA_T00001445001 [Kuraishia capsulata CBS 1993]CDK25475.1 unnamed protein product [Kuraishia capsulata CBS 1993]